MLSDLALGSANPESDSPPLPVATNEVAFTIPLTVSPERVPIFEVVTEPLDNLDSEIAPSSTAFSVTAFVFK